MTTQIILVLLVLFITTILFISEVFRVDIIAILIMLSLAWLQLVTPVEAFSGLASNAVISIIGVMILAYGVDRAGVMKKFARPILQLAGSSEKGLVGFVSTAVGILSAFMQNIGAAALFLPALMRISKKTKISISRLLMPMGFAAILGGTLSMVGSGPLIILNDLLKQGGQRPYGLFSVTPVGLALLGSGIIYFIIFGKFVLPSKEKSEIKESPQQELIETWQLPAIIYQCVIPEGSPMIGRTREEVQLWSHYNLSLLALVDGDDIFYAPWRYTRFAEGQILALLGKRMDAERFAHYYNLQLSQKSDKFEDLKAGEVAGFAEIIIPPKAPIAGKTIRQITMRKTYGVEPIVLLSSDREEREDFSDRILHPGDAIIIHGPWDNIKAMNDNRNFVLVTPVEAGIQDKSRPITAMICFLGAISLALLGLQLSVSLLSGALAMIIFHVIKIDEAYKAIDWRTVFLLAGLIPLGIAMDRTGAAIYISNQMMGYLQGTHPLIILIAFAILSTLFSLFMSNVAATVLLVPLVIITAEMASLNPRALALLIAVCASNSFLLPTHQVNALLMAPGGYRNADYLKAGGIMSFIFLIVSVGFIYMFYL